MENIFKTFLHYMGKHANHEVWRELNNINKKLEKIMATQAQLAAELKAVTAQIQKIGVETGKTLQKVIDLEAIIAAGGSGNTSPEVDSALAELKTQAQLTDDMTPDVPPTEPTVEP